jgi:hypothetical protein
MSAAEQLLNALRETLRSTGKPKRFVADVAGVLAAYAHLEQAVLAAQARWQSLQSALAERANEAEHAASLARTLLSRARDVRSTVIGVREAVEGIRLAALTGGLEGARQGDTTGAALVRWSDEVRERSVLAVESLDGLLSSLEQMDRDREKLRDATGLLTQELSVVGTTRGSPGEAGEEVSQGIGLGAVRTALTELGVAIERATGTDPELAPLLAAAADHARGLASALSQLGSRDGARLAVRSLQPLLEPLITVLGELYGQGRDER